MEANGFTWWYMHGVAVVDTDGSASFKNSKFSYEYSVAMLIKRTILGDVIVYEGFEWAGTMQVYRAG